MQESAAMYFSPKSALPSVPVYYVQRTAHLLCPFASSAAHGRPVRSKASGCGLVVHSYTACAGHGHQLLCRGRERALFQPKSTCSQARVGVASMMAGWVSRRT